MMHDKEVQQQHRKASADALSSNSPSLLPREHWVASDATISDEDNIITAITCRDIYDKTAIEWSNAPLSIRLHSHGGTGMMTASPQPPAARVYTSEHKPHTAHTRSRHCSHPARASCIVAALCTPTTCSTRATRQNTLATQHKQQRPCRHATRQQLKCLRQRVQGGPNL